MIRWIKKDRYFAMYKGDKYVDGGTIVEEGLVGYGFVDWKKN